MEAILLTGGWLAGAIGLVLTAVAAGTRLAGHYWVADYATSTVLQGGIAAMLVGCLAFLAVLASRRGSGKP